MASHQRISSQADIGQQAVGLNRAALAAELNLSGAELDIAMDAIAQLIPHLDLQDCHKLAELVEAQATLLEIMQVRQAGAPAVPDTAVPQAQLQA